MRSAHPIQSAVIQGAKPLSDVGNSSNSHRHARINRARPPCRRPTRRIVYELSSIRLDQASPRGIDSVTPARHARMNTRTVPTILFLSLCCATLPGPSAYSVDFHSPLSEASALQRQLQSVVENACGSVFAVTAFGSDVSDPELFQRPLPASRFSRIAEGSQRSCGSAFAIDRDGHLLTNEHVVSGATSVWVTTDDGNVLPAVVVGTDPRSDLAVLRIPMRTTPITVSERTGPARGEMVVTIGNPGGSSTSGEMAASVGCISATDRALPTLSAREQRFYGDLLQITTPIATGSSGGPLLDLSGRVIGVVCAVVPNTPTEQNIGFAISLSPLIRSRIDRLVNGEEVTYGFLGVNVSPGPGMRGARIDRIEAGAPASGVLAVGDVVLNFDENQVASDIEFIRLAGQCDVGRDVAMTVLRDQETMDVRVRPRRRVLPVESVHAATQCLEWAGVRFANHEDGAIVTRVAPDAQTPLRAGQVLTSANSVPITDVRVLLEVLYRHAGEPLELELLDVDSD